MAEAGAERILYVVKAEGVEETAKAFEAVAEAMDRTAKLQAAMEAAQAKSGQDARIAAYRSEAAAINSAADATGKATQQLNAFSAGNVQAGATTGQLREKISAAGGAVGALSMAAAGAVPEMQGLNSVFGASLRIIPQVLGVMGGGAGGLIAGGLVAAVTGLAAVYSDAAKSAKELDEQQKKVADSAAEVMEYNRKVMAQHVQQRLQNAIDDKYAIDDAAAANAKDKRELELALAAAGQAGTKQTAFDLGAPESRLPAKPKDKGSIGANATNDFIQGQAEFGEVDEYAQKSKSALEHYATLKQAEEDWRAMEGDLITAAAEARNKSDIEQFENLKKLRDKEAAQTQANQQAAMGGFKAVASIGASVTAKLITSAVEGHKISGKAILASIGEAMIGEGTRAIFSGIIDLASLNPLGAVKIGVGTAEIAAGIGFGAAGGGGSTPSASSVSTPSQASTGEFGQSPYRDNSGGGGVVNNTTYVEFSSLTGPTAEDGLRVRQSLDKANNSYGEQI